MSVQTARRKSRSFAHRRYRWQLFIRVFGIALGATLTMLVVVVSMNMVRSALAWDKAGAWVEGGRTEGVGANGAGAENVGGMYDGADRTGNLSGENGYGSVSSGNGASGGIDAADNSGLKNKQETQEQPSDDPLLILVNKDYALPEDYKVELRELSSGLASVAEVLYEDLQEMLNDGMGEGLHFVVCSGYRSPERQQELLDEDIRACMAKGMSYEEAYDEVTRETMPPGHSEHSTGLALDIVSLDHQLLDDEQANTPECRWLRDNAWRYGFILRYPKEKEDITQIDYEAWHFRYVGREAAQYIYENNLTLEEYLENLSG